MSVVRLAEGRYRVFVDLGRDANGRRRRHSEVVKGPKRDAQRRERELRQAQETGTYVDPKGGSVCQFVELWLTSVRSRVEPRTYSRYEQLCRTHVVPDLGHLRLSDVRPLHIEQAEATWLEAGNRRRRGALSPQTVLHLHRMLHTAFDRAVKWRLMVVNPVDGVDAPHVPEQEMGFLTADQARRLVEALRGEEVGIPILVGLYCGLRPTEYLGLRWKDVDLVGGELRVTQNVHRVRKAEGGYRFGPTKTHRSKRPVSIPPELVGTLQVWKVTQARRELEAEVWADLGLVFTDEIGRPLDLDRLRVFFYRTLADAGLARVRLYDLRHTMATLILHETKDLKLVATRLGHSNEIMVLRRYGHLLPGVDRQAAQRLGELLEGR